MKVFARLYFDSVASIQQEETDAIKAEQQSQQRGAAEATASAAAACSTAATA